MLQQGIRTAQQPSIHRDLGVSVLGNVNMSLQHGHPSTRLRSTSEVFPRQGEPHFSLCPYAMIRNNSDHMLMCVRL